MTEVSSNNLRSLLKKLGRNVVSITKSNPEFSPTPWFYLAIERYVSNKYAQPLNPVLKAKDVMNLLLQEFKVSMADSGDRSCVLIIAGGGSYERMDNFIKSLNYGGKWPVIISNETVDLNLDSLVDNRSEFKDDIEYDEEAIAAEILAKQEKQRIKSEKELKRPLNEKEKKTIEVWLTPVIEFFNQHHMNRPIRIISRLEPLISLEKPFSRTCSITFQFKEVNYITKALWGDSEYLDNYAIEHSRAMKLGEILAESGKETENYDEYLDQRLLQTNVYLLTIREVSYICRRLIESCPKVPVMDDGSYSANIQFKHSTFDLL